MRIIGLFFLFFCGLIGCATKSKTQSTSMNYKNSESLLLYKTKADYSQFVPVILNDAKTEIVSYPSPKDIFRAGKLAVPTPAENGYWIDNRGIHSNTVFTNITYSEYAKLKEAPLLSDLFSRIQDKDPIVEIYNLGTRSKFKDEIKNVNTIIKKNELEKFVRIK